jgi:hypothetical protein
MTKKIGILLIVILLAGTFASVRSDGPDVIPILIGPPVRTLYTVYLPFVPKSRPAVIGDPVHIGE